MIDTIVVFIILFAVFVILGFASSRFRKGDLSQLGEWALAGRRLGVYLAWFLVGADLYTAYTFIAIPESVFFKGAIYFYAVPYVLITFAIALVVMPSLWKVSKKKNYVTAVDFVKDRFSSKTLAILIALTGIVAELPYIALQIYGMKAVLQVMFYGYANSVVISEVSLIIAFIILAAFTFWSGLRGAATTAVMKDVLIFITVAVIVVAVPLAYGGFTHAFSLAAAKKLPLGVGTLPASLANGYISLFILSALALYLYPHSVNGVLSSKSVKAVRMSTAVLPIYGVGLALLALFGILIYAVPNALNIVAQPGYGPVVVVPALIYATMPGWFSGVAFLGIFIGGLVPAAIMAISQANLLSRNIIKEIRPNLSPQAEARISKWASVVFKFLALGFIFLIPSQYALSLQLIGGILIVQTLPPIFIGLYTKWLDKNALIAGWVVGIVSGLYILEAANKFGAPTSVLYNSGPLGLLYVAATALALNLLVAVVWSAVANATKTKAKAQEQASVK